MILRCVCRTNPQPDLVRQGLLLFQAISVPRTDVGTDEAVRSVREDPARGFHPQGVRGWQAPDGAVHSGDQEPGTALINQDCFCQTSMHSKFTLLFFFSFQIRRSHYSLPLSQI